MLKLKNSTVKQHLMFADSKHIDLAYFHTPELAVDSDTNLYTIKYTDTLGFTIDIDKKENSILALELDDHSTKLFKLYLLKTYMYSADIKMKSSHMFSSRFVSRGWPGNWLLHVSDYYVTLSSRGYISEIRRMIKEGGLASFNEDGSISKLRLL